MERHVLTRDHTVLPATHTFIHKWNEPYLPLLPSRRASPHFWLVLIFRPAEGRRLSCPGWLGEILRWFDRRRRSPIPVPGPTQSIFDDMPSVINTTPRRHILTIHFSGPDTALGRVCVCRCFRTITHFGHPCLRPVNTGSVYRP